MKNIRYFCEALLLYILLFILRLMPARVASNFGGWMGKAIGLRMGASRKALKNIERVFGPREENQQILEEMWENMGRIIAEYPHIEKIALEHVTMGGHEIADRIKESDKGAIFMGPHLANWEIIPASLLLQYNLPFHVTYRAPNNHMVEYMLQNFRTLGGRLGSLRKSRRSVREIFEILKDGKCIGMMVDQKYNEGLAVPFFGIPAMTNPAFVELAQKFECFLVPIHAKRTNGVNFEITLHEPIEVFDKKGTRRPTEDVIAETHALMEEWIKENPGQWLWLHRRWDSKQFKDDPED